MKLLEHTPNFNESDAVSLAAELYDIRATAEALPSERDQNFHLTGESGEHFVLKIANALEKRTMLESQNRAMMHLFNRQALCPQVFPAKSGSLVAEALSPSGSKHYVRLVSYFTGTPLAKVRRHSPELLRDLGQCVGRVDRILAEFDHPAAHRDFHWDLAKALQVVQEYKDLIDDPELRGVVEECAADFQRNVAPLLPGLRRSIIHNDANDYNVIVGGGEDLFTRNQRVVGLIDFGDMVYSYTVCGLAVAVAYAILDKSDPLATAAHIVQGYHAENPLEDNDLAALPGLVCMRLCASTCLSAYQQRQRPDDAYLSISRQPIRRTLPKVAAIHPRFAEATFRHACALSPVPRSESVIRWLKNRVNVCSPLPWEDLSKGSCTVFDLSIGNPTVSGLQGHHEASALTGRLFEQMASENTRVGVGRYDEPRLFYTASRYQTAEALGGEDRTVHIGMDLFAEAGTPVIAPLDGTVYAFAEVDDAGDVMPAMLLEHHTDTGEPFYTLYGRLSRASVNGLEKGRSFSAGQEIGTVASSEENGGRPPHVHVQIITDLLDRACAFPGVCRFSERTVWKAFSPDPNLILRIPEHHFPRRAPTKAETLAGRKRRIGRNLSIGYRDPVKIERGWMQYLYDETGRKYLDAYNNVPHVGHCHPRVIEAGQRQMTVLNTNTRYLHDFINRYAERLCATMPESLDVCFFVNSASEGNELALRLCRAYTRQHDMIVLEGAYHGHTTSLIDISPYKHDGPGGTGAPPWVHTAPVADVYRGPYKADDPQAAVRYARHVGDIIEALKEKGRAPAGFIAESCPSVGGQIFFPDGYLTEVYRRVRKAGGLCIADEVQTGYGRTGSHFYAFEAQGVAPDIVVLGKPIGNGHPISAVVTTSDIAEAFDNGMEFFSTFGGNTVSCAIGLTVLDVVQEEDLQSHALRSGKRLLQGLRAFKDRYPIVGDVRGSGLFAGIELVRDHDALEPAGEEAGFIADRMRDHGILLGTDGPFHNVVKIRPPMPFSETDADRLVSTMDKILAEDFS